ncbi:hypothetical protein EJ04DRAFT_255244 [Polyplosphaeria fusca]|uniref:Uncharacterized protein n=1 Tax=Polyplosphaeria fusca TaxID=682080 RepID=A0A9P4V368_9PLEO|nr:hypothetical protein EJ04DRAFT_255244 [Polyplosphaeria fusca]
MLDLGRRANTRRNGPARSGAIQHAQSPLGKVKHVSSHASASSSPSSPKLALDPVAAKAVIGLCRRDQEGCAVRLILLSRLRDGYSRSSWCSRPLRYAAWAYSGQKNVSAWSRSSTVGQWIGGFDKMTARDYAASACTGGDNVCNHVDAVCYTESAPATDSAVEKGGSAAGRRARGREAIGIEAARDLVVPSQRLAEGEVPA